MKYSIFRPLTKEEKNEAIPVNSKSILDAFLGEMSKYVNEYSKRYKPYDSYSARMDFDTNVENMIKENSVNLNKKELKIDFGNLDKYGELSRFKYTHSKESKETRLVAGIKQEVIMGHRYFFKCIQRGNKISIYIPNDKITDFEKWLNDNFEVPDEVGIFETKKEVIKEVVKEVKTETKQKSTE